VQTNTSLRTILNGMGDSLNRYGNITFLLGDSPDQLQAMIQEIKVPIEIVSIYAQGNRHVAWINCSRKITKRQKGENNG
jgi:hypothetical protein